ncbi:hypothetical protein TCSYLVIO_008494 [Trypanosoma cruzi]|nr:hypothetical protein TCSYLVIO_008494 [Trypanosoma cruzi]
MSRLLFGKEWRCSRREDVAAEAEHRRGPSSTAAQPIPEGRKVAPRRLGVSKALGSSGHQAVSHGPLAAWRKHGEGHDCGPPVCGALQLGAGCRRNTLGLLRSVRADSCGAVTAAARDGALPLTQCLSASPTMWPGALRTPRWEHYSQLHVRQEHHVPSWQHACLSRDAVLRPCSVRWQMVVRVHAAAGRPVGDTQYALRSHVGKRDVAAANPRCLCRIVGQLTFHAGWGGGEVLSCRR